MTRIMTAASALIIGLAVPAAAEMELSFYLGVQELSDSSGSGVLPGGAPISRNFNWEGNSLEAPIYYGARAIWWTPSDIGFGLEGTHTKAYASSADKAAIGVSRFELSDGHNIITANVMKRWPDAFAAKLTPYVGAGIGVAIPHVDAQVLGAANRTFDYEFTGPAVRGIAGMKYDINDRWAVFGEYQFTWSDNDITIDADPTVPGQTNGKLNTELLTHAINIGIAYRF
ncbi:porin family protein [Roseovarius faecimaris]|uniref:Porin family protein n=1 Tax=Roseovarius faecimaris TaxID=2494550 RepID=A0A6I6IP54_9RHOB|nr:outer membrane beta-barrel protein [Roseovarius faecimaris]QGX97297.1 porin family protein [Roseovarius faecimaris]